MLIDDFAPHREFSLLRTQIVEAEPAAAMDAVLSANLLQSPVPRALMWVRDVPNRVIGRLRGSPLDAVPERISFSGIAEDPAWNLLADEPGREFVAGAIGRFWQRDYGWVEVEPSNFAAYNEPDHAKTLVSFRVEPYGIGRSVIMYESRTVTTDDTAHRRFRRYWLVLRPFIALMMTSALGAIRREAEAV